MSTDGVLVTGASGFLGSNLSLHLHSRGIRVVRSVRQRVPASEDDVLEHTLGERAPTEATFRAHQVTCVVHCAYDFNATTWRQIHQRNVEGTLTLARAAYAAGVRKQIFISTLSAFPGCSSRYGRAKLETEQGMLNLGAAVIRPGLIYNQSPRGLVGTISKLAARFPVIPIIGTGKQLQYTCHLDDLCACIGELLAPKTEWPPPSPIVAAHEQPVRFKDIVRLLAAQAGRKQLLLVPVPWQLVWLGLTMLEALKINIGLRSDSVIGLQRAFNGPLDFGANRSLGCNFRSYSP